MAITADDYVGDCYVCGIGIFRMRTSANGKPLEDEHYVMLMPAGERDDHPDGLFRCSDCEPGSPNWMDSPIGKSSPYRKHFESGQAKAQEHRAVATVQRRQRIDVASPLLKSFVGRIKYFVHMLNVSKDVIPWKLELVDGGVYYEAEFDGETLRIEAGGYGVPFEPKNTLLERVKGVSQ